MSATEDYLIIGADQSQFTHKVRAYFRNNSIPFRDVAAEPQVFRSIILPNAPYPLIPVLLIVSKETQKYKVIQDSKAIMEYVQKTHSLTEVSGTKRAFADMLLEMILDDFFYLAVMYWRFPQKSQQKYLEYTFGDSTKPLEAALIAGAKSLGIIGGRTPALGLTHQTGPVWQEQLRTIFGLLTQNLDTYQYLMGNYPTKADYCMYGLLHGTLMRDPAGYEWAVREFPVVHAYMGRIGGIAVRWGSANHVEVRAQGDKLVLCQPTLGKRRGEEEVEKTDGIPEAVTKIASILMKDYMTVLGPTIDATLKFLNSAGKDEVVIPRGFKEQIEFTIHGPDGKIVREKKLITTHCVWMLQRILDSTYKPEQRAEVDRWLGEVGCLDEWKRIVQTYEQSGWRVDMERQGTVGKRKTGSARL
ncbi:hypothetical protein ABW19_dt0206882 [Dactylella cylindrospora]|nr:hypothetical protein ABW19_dt0206882 [Dactylella cylindrospora]